MQIKWSRMTVKSAGGRAPRSSTDRDVHKPYDRKERSRSNANETQSRPSNSRGKGARSGEKTRLPDFDTCDNAQDCA